MKRIIWYLVLNVCILPVFAQSGPGGIGDSSSNGLWLRAEDVDTSVTLSVSTWPDISGNSNDARQSTPGFQPQVVDSSNLNNQTVIRFDGSDQMQIADDAILDGTGGITFYTAIRFNNLNGSPRGILGKRISSGNNSNYAYTWFLWGSNYMYVDLNTQNDRFSTNPVTFSNGTNYLLGFNFDGSRSSSQRMRLYNESNIVKISTESSTTITNSNQPLTLGALNENYGTYLGADYAELIHFNYSLDTLEHIIVQNYLSAKYDISLSSNDLYIQDNNANGDYDFDVCGIGRINASTIHNDSQGNSIVRILNPSDLGNNEFLFWGHNGNEANASENTDVPFGVEGRFHRTWRVSEVDGSMNAVDVGSLEFRWDLSNYAPIVASDLVMLVDTDNDNIFSDETAIVGASDLGGGIYSFTGVTAITNNVRFTLGTADRNQTPLPVNITYFTSEIDNNLVTLNWQTASEVNNHGFVVEHAYESTEFDSVAFVKGKGNSTTLNNYTFSEPKYKEGFHYYRLKQLDYNGNMNYSVTDAIEVKGRNLPFKIYPNPSSGQITLEFKERINSKLIIRHPSGTELMNKALHEISKTDVDLSSYTTDTGIFFLSLTVNGHIYHHKIVLVHR